MTAQSTGAATRPSVRPKQRQAGTDLGRLVRRPEAGALIGTVGVYVFFTAFGGGQFSSAGGTASWLNVAAELGIIALPVGLLMIAGELDISVGAVLAASSMTFAVVAGHWNVPLILGVLIALLVGLATGFVNGVIVTRTNVPSLVVTLATSFSLVGLTLGLTRLITGTTSVPVYPDNTTKALFGTLLGDKFEVAIFWWIAVVVVIGWVLHFTRYGNWIFAVGGDRESARASGIPVQRVKVVLFMASGFCAALVGIMQAALYNAAQVSTGASYVFNSIIAVVIGGVLLTGGYGSVLGVGFGTLTFAIVNQGIFYTGWNADWASLILGGLLLAAVLMNNTFRRLALSAPSSAPRSKKEV